jgi:hypothetical protein
MWRDPGETTNLAEAHPDIYRELIVLWRAERARLGILLPGDPVGSADAFSRGSCAGRRERVSLHVCSTPNHMGETHRS